MNWWDWFNTAAGAASLLGLWVTIAATILGWWWSRTANKVLTNTSGQTQGLIDASSRQTKDLIERTTANTHTILAQMDQRWQQAWERTDQQANLRQREMTEAIQALKR